MYLQCVFVLSWVLSEIAGETCQSLIYCQGDLLRIVQMSGIFKDSKTFVDMGLIGTAEATLRQFDLLMARTQGYPSRDDVLDFVQQHFQASSNELEEWYPPDHNVNPPFLLKISNERVRKFAKSLIDCWPNLGRKIRPEVIHNSIKYSIIPVPNGFIVPGGRFREFYYWDSYWILKGLLISRMTETAKGMINNFFKMVESFGFVPNGGRIYYLDRSQPPLLTMMAADYMELTNDNAWLKKHVDVLELELKYWIKRKTIQFETHGKLYQLARYYSFSDLPRPESYLEDVRTAVHYASEQEKRQFYQNIRTGAESGWDFSARWFFDKSGGTRAGLAQTNTIRVIPVDLNAFLCRNFKLMSTYFQKVKNKEKAKFWAQKWRDWQTAISEVLYNKEDGIWYDLDLETLQHRRDFYPSNFAPLWTDCYDTKHSKIHGRNASDYLKRSGILNYMGGIPTSLSDTGEQWDFPNAWAPLQAIVIFGLDKTGDVEAKELARFLANRWLHSVIKVHEETHEMFEKYNAASTGMYGGGGEYEVQTGFGWTNGAALEFIEHFYIKNKVPDPK